MLPDSYLATTARRMGVPEMWLEDYCQDFRVEMWLKPNAPEKLVARSRAIDAVRHHCGDRRKKEISVLQHVYIGDTFDRVCPSFEDDVVARLDAEAAIDRLTPWLRRVIFAHLRNEPVNTSSLSKARKRARELAS